MLPSANRITLKSDFSLIKQNGKFIAGKDFSISFLDRKDDEEVRFGFIVSKKISTKANVRNKIKRMFREIVRANLSDIKRGLDIVILAKSGILHVGRDTIEAQFQTLLKESLSKN